MVGATWALVLITGVYVILTGVLAYVGWQQLHLGSNPTVYPHFRAISLWDDPDGVVARFEVAARTIGARPAVNMLVSGSITLFATGTTSERKMKLGGQVVAVVETGREYEETFFFKVPELGRPGSDDLTIPVFAFLTAEYGDTTGARYVSLMNLNAHVSFRTPDAVGSSRGISVEHGMLSSMSLAKTRWNRVKTAVRRVAGWSLWPFRWVWERILSTWGDG